MRSLLVESLCETFLEHSENIALISNSHTVDYGTFDRLSTESAIVLVEKCSGGNGVIGVYVDRSVEAIIAVMAILKAGLVYVPLDPLHPWERTKYIIEDADIGHIIGSEMSGVKTECFDKGGLWYGHSIVALRLYEVALVYGAL